MGEGISQGFGCPQKSRSKGRGATGAGRSRNLSSSSREELSSCFHKEPNAGAVGFGEELGFGWHRELGRGSGQAAGSEVTSL